MKITVASILFCGAFASSHPFDMLHDGLPSYLDGNSTLAVDMGLAGSIDYWGYEEILYDQKGSNCIGGNGGSWYTDHRYGTTLRDISIWTGGDHNGFTAIEMTMMDGTRTLHGDPTSHGDPVSFTFAPGERISGDLTLSGNGVGTRTGYMYFKTTNGRTFSAGDSGHDHYNYPADGRFITGLFGASGSEIDLTGVYFSKPISSTSLSDMVYPTLDLTSSICQPPSQIYSTHVKNPNPIGTTPTSVSMTFSKAQGDNHCWTETTSLSFGMSMEVSGGVPGIVQTKETTTWGIKQDVGFSGCSNSQTTVTETQTVYVPPMKDCYIYVTQCVGKLDNIPYSGTLNMHFTDGTSYAMGTSGSYAGADAMVADVNPVCTDL